MKVRSFLLFTAMAAAVAAFGGRKFYVGAGWDVGSLPPVDMVQSLALIANIPLDGIRFSLKAKFPDGTNITSSTAMDGRKWPVDVFDPQLEDIRKITALPNMKHCFLGVRASPNKRLAWTDDAAWESFAPNVSVLARVAKAASIRGICPDYEDYRHQFQYSLADSDPGLDETLALARKRGAEVHRAMFAAYPEMTLFMWHFLDRHFPHHFTGLTDIPQDVRSRRDLFIAYLNGIFDVLPPSARIVACEEDYKYSAAKRDFYKAIAEEKQFNEQLLDPVHRMKHRLQVSLGFAVYLDAYRPDNQKSKWALGPDKYGSFAGHLMEDVEQATRATDEYVWFWGEKRSYVPWRNPGIASNIYSCRQYSGDRLKTWDAEFGGLYDALMRFKDPVGYAKAKWNAISSDARAVNLADNGDCSSLDGFMVWQKKRPVEGTFEVDSAVGESGSRSIVLKGVHGAVTRFVRNRAQGGLYLVRVLSKGEGDAGVSVNVSFLKDDKWDFKIPSVQIPAVGMTASGWTEHLMTLRIPDGADGFGVKLCGELREGQRAWFDDLSVHELAAACAESACLSLKGSGASAETKHSETYSVKPFVPYRFSLEARKADAKTAGRTLCAGLTGLNVDFNLEEDWKDYSGIVVVPSHGKPVREMPLRFSLWQVTGDVLVRNWSLTEQQAVHATDGTLTLGDGETLLGSRYVFIDKPGGMHHNHSRPLVSWSSGVRLNTDRYPFYGDAEITWKHELQGRKFHSGEVTVAARYFSGGEVRVEVSTDGKRWNDIGGLNVSNRTARLSAGAAAFPAAGVFVRLRGVKAKGVQITAYGFSGTVDGPPLFASGSTEYADVGKTVSPPAFTVPEQYRFDYGELLPGTSSELALWRANSGWKIPRCRQLPSASAKGIGLSMAANETEAVQLVLNPAKVMSNVTVSVEIPSLEAEALKVSYVQVDTPVDYTSFPDVYPDPLPPQSSPMTLSPGENQPFWIKVKAPRNARKGFYSGFVTIRGEIGGEKGPARKIERKVPLSVEVYGFALPDRMTCRSLFGFYTPQVDLYHGLKKREDKRAVYEKYMRKFAEYHLSASSGATYGLSSWYPKWNGDEPIFNWKEWDEGVARGFDEYNFTAIRISRGLGLGGGDASKRREPEIDGVKEGDPRYEVRLAKLLKGFQDHLEEKGWLDRTYIYCFDEPPESDNAFVMNGFAKLAKHAPKLRRFLTSPCRRDLLGGPQVWCPIAPDLLSPLARERQKTGEEFWLYVCMNPKAPYATEFIDHPGVELRTWLWQCWAENIAGVLIWTSNLWTSKSAYPDPKHPQNPYVDAQSWNPSAAPWGNGDGRIFYPPESVFVDIAQKRTALRPGPNFDDPVGSIRGEMLRDGIEDYEYFAILKKLDPENPLLKVPADVSKALDDFSKSPAGIEKHRTLLAREIERLTQRENKGIRK